MSQDLGNCQRCGVIWFKRNFSIRYFCNNEKVIRWSKFQGDLEKEKDLLISPYMDRNNTDQPKMTLGFIDYMVQPMFLSLRKVISEASECVETLYKNRAIWVERSQNEVNVVKVSGLATSFGDNVR
jgi:hypothetical protein